jgi:hypothetical protein
MDFWGSGEQATIGFLRHSEIKHGRVAMAAFVGYCVQANNFYMPFKLTLAGLSYEDIHNAGTPLEQWDALPTLGTLQIFGAISFLEIMGEASYLTEAQGQKHYMMGGKPGFFPSIKNAGIPHPVPLDLWDPFGFTKKMTAERKEKALVAELNNGRLAMFGIMGFIAASKVPGSVPVLDGIIPPYAGEPMGPFTPNDVLPFIPEMSQFHL